MTNMSQTLLRVKMFNNKAWRYPYRELDYIADAQALTKRTNSISAQFSKLAKTWSENINSEWVCRSYFSTKMILNATVLINSIEFCEEKGIRTAIPYYEYYAALSLLRGLVCMLPQQQWDEGALMRISHEKAINLCVDWIAQLNRPTAQSINKTLRILKSNRELISYKAPASGALNMAREFDLLQTLTILAELAQLNSELLERAITKHASEDLFVVLDDHVHSIATVEIDDVVFSDNEDYYRLGYHARKTRRPYNLALFMTEGQTEDFIGAWDGDPDNGEEFSNGSPSNWQKIFDIP